MPTCEHLFLVQVINFRDIFWATIYEKPLTEHSARGFSGESEIRTRDTLLGYTRFPGVLSPPLESFKYADNQLLKLLSFFSNIVLASYLRVLFLPKMISITLGLSVAKLCNHFRFSIKMHTNDNCQPSKR